MNRRRGFSARWGSALACLILTIFLLLPAGALGLNASPATAKGLPTAAPGLFIVKTKTADTLAVLDAMSGVAAANVRPGANRTALVSTPKGKTDARFLAELKANPTVEYAEPNYFVYPDAYAVPPNDPDYNDSLRLALNGVNVDYAKSWWLRDMDTAGTWTNLNSSARSVPASFPVAVIDTGFYSTHPDAGTSIVAKKDEFSTYSWATNTFTTDNDVTPIPTTTKTYNWWGGIEDVGEVTCSHGTCTAGQISAGTNNSVGGSGATYDTPVYVYKVMGIWTDFDPAAFPGGYGCMLNSAVIQAIYDATNDGAKVISMSLGNSTYSAAMQDAIDYAYSRDVVVIASTGNGGYENNVGYPGANNHVMGVGSYRLATFNPTSRTRSAFSDYGQGADPAGAAADGTPNGQVDIMGPGENVWGLIKPGYTNPDGFSAPGYTWWSGTSMAAPAVAAEVAMLRRFAPFLTADQAAQYIYDTAQSAGLYAYAGHGYIRPAAAYAKLRVDYPVLQAPATLTAPNSGTGSTTFTWSPVTGTNVRYKLSIDGSVVTTNATSPRASGALADGSHTVTVQATSDVNWYDDTSARSTTFLIDTLRPVINSCVYSPANLRLTWGVTEANTYTFAYRMDGGGSTTLTTRDGSGNPVLDLTTLTLTNGSHTAHAIATDALSGSSEEFDYTFTYDGNPGAPVITSAAYSGTAATYNLTWTAGAGASGYQVYNGGELVGTTAATSYSVPLDIGTNAITVRSYRSAAGAANTLYSASGGVTVIRTVPAPPTVVYRFYRPTLGTHFYTASPTERDDVIGKYPGSFKYEGEAYRINNGNALNNVPLYRFYNKVTGSHFYTKDPGERDDVIRKYSATYNYEGEAYKVSAAKVARCTVVYRFYNKTNGTHFYTADEGEKNSVVSKLGSIYQLEGEGFYLAP